MCAVALLEIIIIIDGIATGDPLSVPAQYQMGQSTAALLGMFKDEKLATVINYARIWLPAVVRIDFYERRRPSIIYIELV
jgi:hypothetical protein